MRHSFQQYENRSSVEATLNNLEPTENKDDDDWLTFRCTRDIDIGQEFTKRYGFHRWSFFLTLDVYGKNPLSDNRPYACDWRGLQDRADKVFAMIQKCAHELGYIVTYKQDAKRTAACDTARA